MKHRTLLGIASLLLVGCWACTQQAPVLSEEHLREIEEWRAARTERLRSESGWLTLVGLHWLVPGENRFGTDPSSDIVFPEGAGPAHAGSFFYEAGEVRVKAAPDVELTLDGESIDERTLQSDATGAPDVLKLDDLSFYVIERADRHGIRVKNPNSPVRLNFTGIDYFPVDQKYRIEAKFVAYDEPREVALATVIGTPETMLAPGYVRFEIDGETVTLEPVVSDPSDEQYWFVFKDATSGKETYGAGRYLYSDREEDGKVIVDFNKAYNPPCVFTSYATCPLPRKRNWIAARLEAGEKTYGEHH